MAHTCPTCSETCYCMGDHSEINTGQPAYCKHCTAYEKIDLGNCCADCGAIDYCEPWCSIKNKEPIDPEFPNIDDFTDTLG